MTPSHEEARRLLRLARRDHAACHALINAPDVAIEIALFHAQQAVEKSLKAVMCFKQLEFRRTHDLEELAGQLTDADCRPPVDALLLRRLTPYAVEYRYDDEPAMLMDGDQAVMVMATLIAWAEQQVKDLR